MLIVDMGVLLRLLLVPVPRLRCRDLMRAAIAALVVNARTICPDSKATRGSTEVKLMANGKPGDVMERLRGLLFAHVANDSRFQPNWEFLCVVSRANVSARAA